MRGGIGIDELVRAAKGAYLRAAIQAVARQDDRVNISRLSVATGMTRKEVSALLRDTRTNRGSLAGRIGQQRALRVLRGWLTDSRFHNRNGRPDELRYRGDKKSFALLVKLYGGDVTPKSVLRELERIEVVDVTEKGALRLRTSRSRTSIDVHYKLSDLARLFDDFASAVSGSSLISEPPSFFAFKDSAVASTVDAAYFMRRFSQRATVFLEDFQQWSAERASMKPSSGRDQDAIRVGLGVYLLRADRPRTHAAIENSPVPARGRLINRRHR